MAHGVLTGSEWVGLQLFRLHQWAGCKRTPPYHPPSPSSSPNRPTFMLVFGSIFLFWFQDLVVGYMGVPKLAGVPMTLHPQHVTIRNERGAEMWDLVRDAMDVQPTVSTVRPELVCSVHGEG